ncbi:anhydro-N-acetylmuramic acid kinase [Aquabacterium sp. OR-4]|uniref:anhydro-N-acetylmuramic acid kinase n=1 Tax=Aquabacterium sp. OR-4 TaxID=2978127 RepID=UPI0021B40806|nr:anhydro-N-acetylmuramic acid kinase [Aquabacterium sp. OR-4]MDT7837625.1 anhydro-N-acetylmuramic acid kinase [Aquabacterium sp. OR-4]
MPSLCIGLMSGTSLDGVDAVLAQFSASGGMAVLGHVHQAFAPPLRAELLALNRSGADELHRAALAANAVAQAYALAIQALLGATGRAADSVCAVGAHGQTVRHRPGEFDGTGYTAQLLNGALLAERCGIDVVADLRSRDVAAGGQGAPLVPAFHAAVFGQAGLAQAVLNWGGIGNITLLAADGAVSGFDCGPGNVLLDLWCERHCGTPFDEGGAWAAQGLVHERLLARLLDEPFLHRSPPKSTGRDLFHADWLAQRLDGFGTLAPVAVQATLAEFSVRAAALALQAHLPAAQRVLVCGGGALNNDLMARLTARLPGVAVASTASAGLPPLQVEAAAFAWLAWAFVNGRPGNLPAVTGAAGLRRLGCLHPAR